MTFQIEARLSAISAMASRIEGIAISPSMTRMTKASKRGRKPAKTPISTPRMVEPIATEKPTMSETRVP